MTIAGCIVFILFQIESAVDNESLRDICLDSMELAIEAGYNKPLVNLCSTDKSGLLQTLGLHFTIFCSKAVLDQFKEGLQTLGVLDAIVKYSKLMEPLFVSAKREPLTASK